MFETLVANLATLLPFGYAFGAGMVTTVSPCGIAMLPAYVSLYLGVQEEGYWAKSLLRRGSRALLLSAVVTLSFVAFFGVMGAAVMAGGQFLFTFIPWMAVVIGVILILLGVYLLIGGHVYTNLPARLAGRLSNLGGSGIKGFLVFGIAYGIAALSCTLPVFLVVVGSALAMKGFTSGLLQFVSYALGMGFIITVVTIGSALFKEASMNWYIQVLKKYVVFSGRARRKEYWYFVLFNIIIGVVLGLIDRLVWNYNVLPSLYNLAVLLPSIGVAIRRLHDTGRSGWWLFIGLIPLIGAIILIIYMASDSQAGTNQYGPSPKQESVNQWLRRLVPVVARLSGLLLIFAGGYILYFWFTVGDILSWTFGR